VSAASEATKDRACAHCRTANANRQCARCKHARYCSGACQKAHYATHKADCCYEDEYPRRTLERLTAAFPHFTVRDGAKLLVADILPLLDELERQPTHMVVVLRRRGNPRSEQLFRFFARGATREEDLVATAMSVSSSILVFHKDAYHHMPTRPFDELARFIRHRVTEAQPDATQCRVCQAALPAQFCHRMVCHGCGCDSVCGACVLSIRDGRADKCYACPQCGAQPVVANYSEANCFRAERPMPEPADASASAASSTQPAA
jgi:hypothetical protein